MRYSLALACAMMSTPLAADTLRVVTDFPVTHSLVSMVMGETGTADLLLDRGGDPHSFQLRPSQARDLTQADLVFWVGEELTPWLARALAGVEAEGKIVTLITAEGLRLREFGEDHGHEDHAHDDHGHEHAHDDHAHDDHGHDDHAHDDHVHDDHGHDHAHDDHAHDDHGHDDHAHDDHGHDDHAHEHDHAHTGTDPHLWMNTGNVEIWLAQIAAELSEKDPQNAETYAANAAAARAEIGKLRQEIAATLAPVGTAPLIVFHDAYGYFSEEFGVNVAGTIALGDAAAPGAQRLAELRAQLQQEGAVCIFPEVNHSARYVDVVVEGTDIRIGGALDPEGMTLEPGPRLYPSLMRGLAQSIADCVAG
jgi:zinc transport system substrate-binding protein